MKKKKPTLSGSRLVRPRPPFTISLLVNFSLADISPNHHPWIVAAAKISRASRTLSDDDARILSARRGVIRRGGYSELSGARGASGAIGVT